MGITKKELADTLGVSKQTVVNYIDRLGIAQEHVSRVGKYDILAVELADLRASRDREVESLRMQLNDANRRAAELADRVATIAERQQAIAATPWWKRGRIAMKLLGPGSE